MVVHYATYAEFYGIVPSDFSYRASIGYAGKAVEETMDTWIASPDRYLRRSIAHLLPLGYVALEGKPIPSAPGAEEAWLKGPTSEVLSEPVMLLSGICRYVVLCSIEAFATVYNWP